MFESVEYVFVYVDYVILWNLFYLKYVVGIDYWYILGIVWDVGWNGIGCL